MTVDETIEMLNDLKSAGHGKKEVMFAYNYGDYGRSTVAAKAVDVQVGLVEFSAYLHMHKMLGSTNDGGDEFDILKAEHPKAIEVVIIE